MNITASSLAASRKRFGAILSQYKLNLAVHVLVVDGLAFLEIDASARLEGFLIEARATVLIENALFAEHPIDDTAGVLHVVVLHEDGASNEARMTDGHFRVPGPGGKCEVASSV